VIEKEMIFLFKETKKIDILILLTTSLNDKSPQNEGQNI
jgi:hypothetical protein